MHGYIYSLEWDDFELIKLVLTLVDVILIAIDYLERSRSL